jgi:hypothetical protein
MSMSNTWGTAPPKPKGKRPKVALNPKSVRAGHQGIAWLHVSGIAIWLLVALVFGILMAAGKSVPPALLIATLGAAAGHGIFLATHLLLASAAKKRAASYHPPVKVPTSTPADGSKADGAKISPEGTHRSTTEARTTVTPNRTK